MNVRVFMFCLGGLASCLTPASVPSKQPGVHPSAPSEVRYATNAARAEAPLEVAVTFDDLPCAARFSGTSTSVSILERIIGTLKRHAIGGVTGFVNGINVKSAGDRAALDAWLQAGNNVGNHTYAHVDLRTTGLSDYLADIDRNEPLLEELTRAQGQPGQFRTFRAPFLEEGRDLEQRRAIRAHLLAHGYRLAPVTVDFGDWAWTEPYARCLARADAKAVDALRASFVRNARMFLRWSDAAARQIYGRPIRHVLLLHAYDFTAEMLDALLVGYVKMGVQFISFEDALADSIYEADPGAAPSHGSTFLEQVIDGQGAPHPPYLAQPLELLDALCR